MITPIFDQKVFILLEASLTIVIQVMSQGRLKSKNDSRLATGKPCNI